MDNSVAETHQPDGDGETGDEPVLTKGVQPEAEPPAVKHEPPSDDYVSV